MKHLLLFILCTFLLIRLDAQTITENRSEDSPRFHLGVGTGFDNFTGLIGVSGTLRVSEMVSLRGGFGIGGWGTKSSIGIKLDKGADSKWAYNLGYSAASGIDDLPLDMELSNGQTAKVKVDYLSASTLNLAIDRNWKVGRSNIFYLEFGYAIPMQGQRWKVADSSDISINQQKVLDIMQPGGIIFGIGFAFGL